MKKFYLVAVSILMVLCMVGCGSGTGDSVSDASQDGYNLELYVSQGRIPELEYTLGANPETIKGDHSGADAESQNGHSHDEVSEIINGDIIQLNVPDSADYFYKSDKKDAGISAIITMNTAFGVEIGELTTPADIKNSFSNITFTETNVASTELFFMPIALDGVTALFYSSGPNTVSFYFQDNALIAVGLTDTANW